LSHNFNKGKNSISVLFLDLQYWVRFLNQTAKVVLSNHLIFSRSTLILNYFYFFYAIKFLYCTVCLYLSTSYYFLRTWISRNFSVLLNCESWISQNSRTSNAMHVLSYITLSRQCLNTLHSTVSTPSHLQPATQLISHLKKPLLIRYEKC
jgi:hypothetical protein